MLDAPRRPRLDPLFSQTFPMAGLGVLAVGLVAFFDLGTQVPLSDEFFFRWTVARFVGGHGFHLWPGSLPLSLVQLATGAIAYLAVPDVRVMRLSVLPFLALSGLFTWKLARAAAADRFWSAVAAAAFTAAPITLAVATGFMSDIAYCALLAGALLFGYRWLALGRGLIPCVVLAILATLQRQHGIGIPVAIAAGAVASRGGLRLTRREWRGLSFLAAGAVGALVMPWVLGFRTEAMATVATAAIVPGLVINLSGALVTVPVVVGFFALPLLLGLAAGSPPKDAGRRRGLVAMILAVTTVSAAAVFALYFHVQVFPGDVWGATGLGQVHLGGDKPSPWPSLPFHVVEFLAVLTAAVALWKYRLQWTLARLQPIGVVLTVAALTQVLPMAITTGEDRYDLPVAIVLLPLLAAWITEVGGGLGAGTSLGSRLVAAGMGVYAVGKPSTRPGTGQETSRRPLPTRPYPRMRWRRGTKRWGLTSRFPRSRVADGCRLVYAGWRSWIHATSSFSHSPPTPALALITQGRPLAKSCCARSHAEPTNGESASVGLVRGHGLRRGLPAGRRLRPQHRPAPE